jgi:hypothetical protein
VMTLLDLYEHVGRKLPKRNQFAPGWDLISLAAAIARTPHVPVPTAEQVTTETVVG